MGEIRDAIHALVAAEHPMTVRQVFYRLVTEGLIKKTEAEYKGTVCRLLAQMRLDGEMPFPWIADNSRWIRKPKSFSGLGDVVDSAWRTYRRALWDRQPDYVEIWLEKEALSGVLYEVTSEWDVPLMVTRGYPSLSFLYEAAQTIELESKPVYLYYFGDLDPSGLDIARNVEDRLADFAYSAEIIFERAAVTVEQVATWNLPTRPTKRSDTRSKGWAGGSVELDAIPPIELRQLVRGCIEQHVDRAAHARVLQVEEEERDLLSRIVGRAAREIEDADLDERDE